MHFIDKAVTSTETSNQASKEASQDSMLRRRRAWCLLRRLWVLPAFTLALLVAFGLLLGRATPAEAQGTPNLVLLKSGSLLPVQIGNKVVYTLTLSNIGLGLARNITVTDPAPVGLIFESFGGACSGPTCNIPALGSVIASGTRSIQITFTVPLTYDLIANPIITNTAFVTASTADSNLSNNRSNPWGTLVFAVADLELSKTANSDVIARGENVTYTLTLTNSGPNTAFAVSILDLMTPTLPFVSGSSSPCSFVPLLTGTIALCNNVAAGATVVLTAVHAVPLNWVTPTVMNVGLAGTLSVEPDYFNNVANQTITITSRADMSITKAGPPAVVPGTDAIYTLTVKNIGPSIATTVTVDDPGFNGLTATVGEPCAAGFPCDLGAMWPHSTTQIVMTYSVPSSFTETEVVNTASVTSPITDPVDLNNTASVTVPVTLVSDLAIQKDAPATAVPGTLIIYTVAVTNNGPSDAYAVTLTDLDPISLTAAGNPCVAGVCSLPDLPLGSSATLTLTFNIDPFARGTVTNTASVTSTGTPTPVVTSAFTELTPEADLSVSKADGLDDVPYGTTVTYTIIVTNNGPSGVSSAVLSDTFPMVFEEVEWTCAAVAPNACDPASDDDDLLSNLTLAPGGVATVTAMGDLPTSGDETVLTNTAEIAAPAGVTETNAQDNSSTDLTNLVYVTDLSITKTVTPADSIAPGELFTYTLVVGNAGPSTANNATVSDWLPGQMNDAQWSCEAGDEAVCSAASGSGSLSSVPITLEPASLVTFTITGTLDLYARNAIYNEANVMPDVSATDSNKDNNRSWTDTPIQSKAFIAFGKTDGQTIAVPGTMLTYIITLENQGPSNANGLLFDLFPPELSNAQWASDGINGAQVISDLAGITTTPGVQVDLPAGSLLTVTVSAQVNLTATGWLTNIAQFAMGNETERIDDCATACGAAVQEELPPEGETQPKPIINTNPITQAIDANAIVPAQVTGRVFNDLNGDGLLDAGEPALPGVQVVVTGNGVSAVTVTVDANGLFTVTVPPGAFAASVVTGSVPAGFVLTSNNASQNGVAAAGNNATVPIGYQGRGRVEGLAFNDINGNQDLDAGEAGLPNVVVTLQPMGNQPAAAGALISATTDANGNYAMANVPAGGYMLNAQAPAGFVNTTPLPQNVAVSPNASTAVDLGFQQPGALVITKGAQASGNGNLLGPDRLITYTLTITNVGGGLLNNVAVTDTLESYLQYVNGSATPAPLSTSPLVWQLSSLAPGEAVSIRFVARVADGFGGTALNTAIAGSQQVQSVQSNEVSISPAPTAISIVRFTAQRDAGGVTVQWQTGFERNTLGFNLLRSATGSRADAIQVNAEMIPAGAKGGEYTFVDASADAGALYTYWLQEIEMSGQVNDYPETAVVQGAAGQGVNAWRVFVPAIMR
jgi:uncharacterized repeat protein (TIGR01451 family)